MRLDLVVDYVGNTMEARLVIKYVENAKHGEARGKGHGDHRRNQTLTVAIGEANNNQRAHYRGERFAENMPGKCQNRALSVVFRLL